VATLLYLTGLLTASGYITLFNWIVDGQWLLSAIQLNKVV
jgi:hypothetical protein